MTPGEHLRRHRIEGHARRVMTDLYARFDEGDVADFVACLAMLWLDERVIAPDEAGDLRDAIECAAAAMKARRAARGLDPTVVDPSNGPDGHGVPDGAETYVPGEYWVQGDCVRLESRSAIDAIARYRAGMEAAQIAISQGVHCDALHARRIARGHFVMRQTLAALVAGQRLGAEATELLAAALRNGALP